MADDAVDVCVECLVDVFAGFVDELDVFESVGAEDDAFARDGVAGEEDGAVFFKLDFFDGGVFKDGESGGVLDRKSVV